MTRLTRLHALGFMVLCLLVAAALRLPELSTVPPGLHYDEAANGILAGNIGLRGDRPIFISSYTGKEVLFFYLGGAIMRLVGESVFSLRLTAAYAGILTVAATYWLGRAMLADRRLALLAASLLAASFWHVLFSRLGFRAITEPLLQALTVAALFQGIRREEKRWLLFGGIGLGLTAYTYLAARLFPLLLLLAFVPLLLDRQTRSRRWRQLALFLGVALVTALPLLAYFWSNPSAFWVRITQVAPAEGAPGLSLGESLLRSFGMLFLRGDPFWRFNLPGRPLFDWMLGAFLVIGWVVALLRWRRYPYDWQRAAMLLLIFSPLVMILPTALATNELVPSNLRAIGLIPFVFFLPAIGVVILFRDIERRWAFPPLTAAVLFVVLVILVNGGLVTAHTYFLSWAGEETLYYESDGDLAAVARYLNSVDPRGKTIYVAAPHYRHPTVAFLSANYESVKWLPDAQALVVPPRGAALIIYPHNSPAPEWALPWLAEARLVGTPPVGEPAGAFQAYELAEQPDLAPQHEAGANFGNAITLLGYDVAKTAAGDALPVTLYWQVQNAPAGSFAPFLQLEDAWGRRWSQEETFAYPAEQWAPGEIIIQHALLPVPLGTPPGAYRLRIGLFDGTNGETLPRLDAAGRFAGNAYFAEDVAIGGGPLPEELPQPPYVVDEPVMGGLRLLGYEREGLGVAAGAPWGIALWWAAEQSLPPMRLTFELLDGGGEAMTVLETQPVHGTYPFEQWATPLFLIDPHTLRLPSETPAGTYRLRLHLRDENGAVLYTEDLGPLAVERSERRFEAPTVEQATAVRFGQELALLGYTLGPLLDGTAPLDLVWQAQQAPADDYTVFVHLLNTDGTCCLWQQDAMPLQNQYPTSQWLPGEVVVDRYLISPPPDLETGVYPLEIGLYKAETGQRLTAVTPGGSETDAFTLSPLEVP